MVQFQPQPLPAWAPTVNLILSLLYLSVLFTLALGLWRRATPSQRRITLAVVLALGVAAGMVYADIPPWDNNCAGWCCLWGC